MMHLTRPPAWTPRHAALAAYLGNHSGTFTGPALAPALAGAGPRADPEWRQLGHAIGTPDAQLVREVVRSALPLWLGIDADLVAGSMRLACAGNTAAALALAAVALVILELFLLSRSDP